MSNQVGTRYCPNCGKYINSLQDFIFCGRNYVCQPRVVHEARNLAQTTPQNVSEDEVLDALMAAVQAGGGEGAFTFVSGDATTTGTQAFVPALGSVATAEPAGNTFDAAQDLSDPATDAIPDSVTQ